MKYETEKSAAEQAAAVKKAQEDFVMGFYLDLICPHRFPLAEHEKRQQFRFKYMQDRAKA